MNDAIERGGAESRAGRGPAPRCMLRVVPGKRHATARMVCFAPASADRRRRHWADRRLAARVAAARAFQAESTAGCRAPRELYVPRNDRALGARTRNGLFSV